MTKEGYFKLALMKSPQTGGSCRWSRMSLPRPLAVSRTGAASSPGLGSSVGYACLQCTGRFYFFGGLFPLSGPDGLPVLLGKLGLGRLPPPLPPPFPPPPFAIVIDLLMAPSCFVSKQFTIPLSAKQGSLQTAGGASSAAPLWLSAYRSGWCRCRRGAALP